MSDTFEEWSGAMADRLNEMARECGFDEVENGSQAAGLIREIHGKYNTHRFARAHLEADRDRWKALAGEQHAAMSRMVSLMKSMRSLGYFTNPVWISRLEQADKALTNYTQAIDNLNQGEE